MIEGNPKDGYVLTCDDCGDECDELFESFNDAVAYKKDKDNNWKSIKNLKDEWMELCPDCSTPENIAKLKGVEA